MRLAWISHEANLDGTERCLVEAARGLVASGHEVQVSLPWRGSLEAELTRIPVPVHIARTTWWAGVGPRRAPYCRLRRLCRNLVGGPGLCRLLRVTRPDVVVSNTLTILMGAFAARQAKIPHVWYIHELVGKGHDLAFDFGDRLSRFLLDRLSDRIIVNSRAVKEKFAGWFPTDKLRLVYSAVEVSAEPTTLEADEAAMRLIVVGRIEPLKRQEDAVRAVSLLARKGRKTRLTLVGRETPEYGPWIRRLVALIREKGNNQAYGSSLTKPRVPVFRQKCRDGAGYALCLSYYRMLAFYTLPE
jgi:glycosyltransferase involved in cell wall biosynthesis